MSPLFLITGVSGAGKSTLADRLLKQHPDFTRFVTSTTRAPRPGEQDGKQYHFLTRKAFEDGVAADHFYEWATVYGHYYGSDKREMERLQAAEQPIILVIDVQGARAIKRLHPEAHLFFIDAPREDLMRRLQDRKMPQKDFEQRVKKIEEEHALRAEADVVILNRDGSLPQSLEMLERAIERRLS